MIRRRGFTLVEVSIVLLVIGLIIAIAVPNFLSARVKSRLSIAVVNLEEIEAAKKRMAVDQKLLPGSVINDSTDLVPRYMTHWPTGPISGATYAANSVGTDPTINGFNESQIKEECTNLKIGCPF